MVTLKYSSLVISISSGLLPLKSYNTITRSPYSTSPAGAAGAGAGVGSAAGAGLGSSTGFGCSTGFGSSAGLDSSFFSSVAAAFAAINSIFSFKIIMLNL